MMAKHKSGLHARRGFVNPLTLLLCIPFLLAVCCAEKVLQPESKPIVSSPSFFKHRAVDNIESIARRGLTFSSGLVSSLYSRDPKFLTKRAGGDAYAKAAEKGKILYCLFSKKETAASESQYGGPSKFTNEADLLRWGWVENVDSGAGGYGDKLDVGFKDAGIDTANEVSISHIQSEDWKSSDGKNRDATFGQYDSVMIPGGSIGAVVADNNHSPKSYVKKGEPVPDLNAWSDVAYLQWQVACSKTKASVSTLNYFFRAHIQNSDTMEIIRRVLQDLGHKTFPSWDNRVTIQMKKKDAGSMAILGSPNGAGICFFLIQHKAQLGLKKISEVVIWNSNGDQPLSSGLTDTFVNLRFTVANVGGNKRDVDDGELVQADYQLTEMETNLFLE